MAHGTPLQPEEVSPGFRNPFCSSSSHENRHDGKQAERDEVYVHYLLSGTPCRQLTFRGLIQGWQLSANPVDLCFWLPIMSDAAPSAAGLSKIVYGAVHLMPPFLD